MTDFADESYPLDVEAAEHSLLPAKPENDDPQVDKSTVPTKFRRVALFIYSASVFKSSGQSSSTAPNASGGAAAVAKEEEEDVVYIPVATEHKDDDPEVDNSSTSTARIKFRQVALLIHYALRFKLLSSGSSVATAAVTQEEEDVRLLVDLEEAATDEPHRFQRKNIAKIVKKKNLDGLRDYGGVERVAEALDTDLNNGIKSDRVNTNEAVSLRNTNELSQALAFFPLFKEDCKSYTILLLSVAAVLSLAFGIYQDGLANGWFDGTILFLAVFGLIGFAAIRCYLQARWYRKRFLRKQWFSEERINGKVEVIREGDRQIVHSSDLRVGDIACLQKGYQVPGDGIFVSGEALQLDDGLNSTINDKNPFMFYGSRVINGDARMIVVSVGVDTVWSKKMSEAMEFPEKKCKFEVLLHKLRQFVDFVGLLLSVLILVVMFLRNLLEKRHKGNDYSTDPKGEPTRLRTIIDIIKVIIEESEQWGRVLIASLIGTLVAIMDGVPSVISIAVSHQSRKTLADNASEKAPLACFKMALVTAICTDSFGGLTQHGMEVDNFFVDKEFVGASSMLSPNLMESLCDGIGISSLLPQGPSDLKDLVPISWAKAKFGLQLETLRNQCSHVHEESCNFAPECSKAVMLKTTENRQETYVHFKGPPLEILSMCSTYYSIEGEIKTMDDGKRKAIEKASEDMPGGRELIGYACKRTDESTDMSLKPDGERPDDLIFVGMIGLRNIDQDEIRKAVSTLREGGVKTILVSEDGINVLGNIAEKYGLRSSESFDFLTSEEFRNLTKKERMRKVDAVCIMAGCSLQDKARLVKYLREKGQVVAMVGQRVQDSPALKEADIGLALGTWSPEIARYFSDIFISNGDFTSVLNLIKSGRCIYENIRRFIQLQLVMIISSSAVNFIATLETGDSPMTVIELFWLSLVVAILGGLSLLAEQPTENIPPIKSPGRLITNAMWRNIALQASYQTAICLILLLKGDSFFGISTDLIQPMICNILFLCQLFNIFIARETENKNIFKGLDQTTLSWVTSLLFLLCQGAMVAVENALNISPRLSWKLWASCILIGIVSWPLDFAGKFASDFITCHPAAD